MARRARWASRARRAAQLIDDRARAGRRPAAAQEHPAARRRARRGRASARRSRPPPSRAAEPAIVWEDDALLVIDKPAGPRRASGARATAAGRWSSCSSDAQRVPLGAARRAPPRPRHVRPDAGGKGRAGAAAAAGTPCAAARSSASTWRSWPGRLGSRTGTIDAPLGRDRAPAHAHVDADGPQAARGAHPLRGRASCPARSRSCGCASRRAARTRSGPTSPRSGTRSPATASTAGRPSLGLERQFLHSARLALDPASGGGTLARAALCAPGRPRTALAALER